MSAYDILNVAMQFLNYAVFDNVLKPQIVNVNLWGMKTGFYMICELHIFCGIIMPRYHQAVLYEAFDW